MLGCYAFRGWTRLGTCRGTLAVAIPVAVGISLKIEMLPVPFVGPPISKTLVWCMAEAQPSQWVQVSGGLGLHVTLLGFGLV